MDYELLKVDFYNLTKDKLIPLVQKYNVKVDDSTTVRELRPICALLKAHLQKAESDKYYEQILNSFITAGDIHPEILAKNACFEDLTGIFNNLPPENLELLLKQQKLLYDKLLTEKRKVTVHDSKLSVTLQKVAPEVKQEPKMEAKIKVPLITPNSFSGLPTENITTFIDKFTLAAKINNWTPELQQTLIESFLAGVAHNYFILYKKRNPAFTIEQLFTDFKIRFTPTAQANDLQLLINTKTQDQTEDNLNFITSMEFLCKKWKNDITEPEIVSYILTSVKPDLCEYLTNYDITTLADLYKYVQKFEKQSIIRKINSSKTHSTPTQLITDPVLNEIKQLRDSIHALNIQRQNDTFQKNKTSDVSSTQKNKFLTQPMKQSAFYQSPVKRTQIQRMSSSYNKPQYDNFSFRPTNYQGRNVQKQIFPARNFSQTVQPRCICNYCNKPGHRYQNCYNRQDYSFKNNMRKNVQPPVVFPSLSQRQNGHKFPRNMFCTICKKSNHTATNCYFNNNNNTRRINPQGSKN